MTTALISWMGRSRTIGLLALIVLVALSASCKDRRKKKVYPDPVYDPARPVLINLSDSSGFLGDQRTLIGANFDLDPARNIVSFNGGIATVTAASTNALVTTVPLGASSGPVTVTIDGKISNSLDFSILGGPQIIQILPDRGPTGTLVTIQGLNFSPIPGENIILFDWNGSAGVQTAAISALGGQLVCFAPSGATSGPVVVQVGGLTSNADHVYTYLTPTLVDVTPRSGFVGNSVSLLGINFSLVLQENIIRFNGTVAQTLSAMGLPGQVRLDTVIPSGAAAGPVTVEVAGFESNAIFFCVWTPAPNLSANISVSPGQGAWGDPVTIQGSGFATNTTDNEVRFNGILATVMSATSSAIAVLVPDDSTTGPVVVRRGPETGSTTTDFMVTNPAPPPPTLDALKPASAPELTSIVIEGSGFNPIPKNNIVTFDGIPAEVLGADPTSLLVKVPFTNSGVVTVDVSGQQSNGLNFTVQQAAARLNTFPLFGRQLTSPSDSVIFIVDRSGSMGPGFPLVSFENRFGQWVTQTRLALVQDRLIFSVSELPNNFRFDIITYSSTFPPLCVANSLWQPAPVPATQANKDSAIAWINTWFAQGGTATTFAVEAAFQIDPTNQTICLITDGEWNCPSRGVESDADQLCRMFNANLQNAEMHTFGIELGANFEDLLRDMAGITGGTYTRIASPVPW
ncbi:MAG: IPT/TIG domain-containing protein [Planctomycetota bacterium]|nr:IPT/TIG domain-containing protein [Planctomycetota bacterium]